MAPIVLPDFCQAVCTVILTSEALFTAIHVHKFVKQRFLLVYLI